MGLIVPSMLALLACWRVSAAGEANLVVSNPAFCQDNDSAKDALGSCSDGVVQPSSRKGARSLLQNQQSRHLAPETPRYGPFDQGFCKETRIGKQLTAEDVSDCATKCQKEERCAFFSYGRNGQCRLFEKCSTLKGGWFTPWNTYTLCKPECTGCDLFCGELPAPVARKRGYGHKRGEEFSQCNDTVALGLEDSWYYNGSPFDSPNRECYRKGKRTTAEFVPQVLSCDDKHIWEIFNSFEILIPIWKRLGVKFLLTFNEPDGDIHHCTPREAAEVWHMVQQMAEAFDPPLRIVSPAPTSKDFVLGNSKWLNEFFEECERDRRCDPESIEFIAFHDDEGDFDVREDNIQARIEGAAAKYKRKLWLTEYNVGCSKTSLCRDCENTIYRDGKCNLPKNADDSISVQEHLAQMKKAIPFFEKNEHIFRYTWFGARSKPSSHAGYSQLLPYNSTDQTLTELGKYYRDAEG